MANICNITVNNTWFERLFSKQSKHISCYLDPKWWPRLSDQQRRVLPQIYSLHDGHRRPDDQDPYRQHGGATPALESSGSALESEQARIVDC